MKHQGLTGYMKQRGNDAFGLPHEEVKVTAQQRPIIKRDSPNLLRHKHHDESEETEQQQDSDRQDPQRLNTLPTSRVYDLAAFDGRAKSTANTPRQRRGENLRIQPPRTVLERDAPIVEKANDTKRGSSVVPVAPSKGIEVSQIKQEYYQGRPFYETDTDHMDDSTISTREGNSKESQSLQYNPKSSHDYSTSNQLWEDSTSRYPHGDPLGDRVFPLLQDAQGYGQPPAASSTPDEEEGEEYDERIEERTEEGETDDNSSSDGAPAEDEEDDPTLDTSTLQAMQREAELARQAQVRHVTYRFSPSMQLSPSPPPLPMRALSYPQVQAYRQPREVVTVPSPTVTTPSTPLQVAQSSIKRPVSLDYTPAELSSMAYVTLASESFDHDPQAPPVQTNPSPAPPPAVSLTENLINLSSPSTSSDERRAFFSSLPITDYEEAGDLLLSHFADTIQKFKDARRERRKIAGEFEAEIARREERVRSRAGGIEKEVGRLRRAGQDVVRGKSA